MCWGLLRHTFFLPVTPTLTFGLAGVGGGLWLLVLLTDPVLASNVAAGLGDQREMAVPTWLFLLTGGAAIGASGLLAAFVTDRTFIQSLHEWAVPISVSFFDSSLGPTPTRTQRTLETLAAVGGVLTLFGVLAVAFFGPPLPTTNLAILLTFVGLRALLPMIAVTLGNPWPALNPFRTLSVALLPTQSPSLEYPDRLGRWPAVAALATLVSLELLLPLSSDPRVLGQAIILYGALTVAGAVLFSPAVWFDRVDPLAVIFRFYGAVGPIQFVETPNADLKLQPKLVLPGSGLRAERVLRDASDLTFVLLLVWELTVSGFIVTPPGAWLLETMVAYGFGPTVSYLLVFVGGFGILSGLYWAGAALARPTAPTYLSTAFLARRFGAPLLAIAGGYHVAHYFGFALNLSPAFLAALANPLAPPVNPTTLAIPDWIGAVEIGAVVVGHLLAIWVAHAIAFDTFPGRLQAIRSQYPFVALMIGLTVLSLWLLSLPTSPPPFLD